MKLLFWIINFGLYVDSSVLKSSPQQIYTSRSQRYRHLDTEISCSFMIYANFSTYVLDRSDVAVKASLNEGYYS